MKRERVMSPRRGLGLCASIAIVALAGHPTTARAQGPSQPASTEARAETLFREGLRAMNAQDYLTAKQKFEASQQLTPGAGTLLNLGYCYEQLGLPTNAYRVYRDAVALAEQTHRTDRARTAIGRIAVLKAKIGLVDVVVAQPGVKAFIDGIAVTEGTVPLDEGRHLLRATLSGHAPWSTEVAVTKGARVEIVVPELPPDEGATASAQPRAPTPPPAPDKSSAAASSATTRRALGLGLAGAGVVGIGVGLVLGANAKSTYDDTSAHCNDQVCDQEGVDLTNRAKTSAAWATVATGVGVAALAGGLVLYFTTPSSGPKLSAGAAVTPRGARATFAAAF